MSTDKMSNEEQNQPLHNVQVLLSVAAIREQKFIKLLKLN